MEKAKIITTFLILETLGEETEPRSIRERFRKRQQSQTQQKKLKRHE